jgi:hypothetical protein
MGGISVSNRVAGRLSFPSDEFPAEFLRVGCKVVGPLRRPTCKNPSLPDLG